MGERHWEVSELVVEEQTLDPMVDLLQNSTECQGEERIREVGGDSSRKKPLEPMAHVFEANGEWYADIPSKDHYAKHGDVVDRRLSSFGRDPSLKLDRAGGSRQKGSSTARGDLSTHRPTEDCQE